MFTEVNMTFQSLQHPVRWLFLFHALGGAIALAILLVPLLARKGGKLHTRAGLIYSYAMIFVGISALIITPWRVFLDPARTSSSAAFAAFLFFIAVFTLCALWYGIVVLKFKSRKGPSRALAHVAPPITLIVLAIATQLIGITIGNGLLIAFPFLGLVTARGQLRYWLGTPQTKMHWWYEHMSGMFTACIATITAFLVTAVPRLWPDPIAQSPILWIAPGLVLGTLLNRWTASYRVKFGDASLRRGKGDT